MSNMVSRQRLDKTLGFKRVIGLVVADRSAPKKMAVFFLTNRATPCLGRGQFCLGVSRAIGLAAE